MPGWPYSDMDDPTAGDREAHLDALEHADAAADRLDDMAPAPPWRTEHLVAAYERTRGQWRAYVDEQAMTAQLVEIRDLPEAS